MKKHFLMSASILVALPASFGGIREIREILSGKPVLLPENLWYNTPWNNTHGELQYSGTTIQAFYINIS
jgi:predicted Rossmann-fold nucleotide-binding protein